MDKKLPKSNILIVIASSLVFSVGISWKIAIHFEARNQHEFDRIHARLIAIEKMLPLIGDTR